MKRLLKALGLLLGISAPVLAGVSGPPAGNYIVDYGTTTSQHIFNVTSGTVSGAFYNNALTNGQCVQAGTGGLLTSAGFACGSGGGGGSSSLAISAGVSRSSPTSDAIFPASQFIGSVSGSSMTVTLNPSSVTLLGNGIIQAAHGGTGTGTTSLNALLVGTGGSSWSMSGGLPQCSAAYDALAVDSTSLNFSCNPMIQNTNSLQSGATFYVSSGTVQGQFADISLPAGSNPSTGTFLLNMTNSTFGHSTMNIYDTANTGGFQINYTSNTTSGSTANITLNAPSVNNIIGGTSYQSVIKINNNLFANGAVQLPSSVMNNSSATITGAGGLGVTYGVSAGSLTITGSGWPSFVPNDGNTYTIAGTSTTPVTVGHLAVYSSTNGVLVDGGAPGSGGTPGGSNYQVQFDSAGVFGGTSMETVYPSSVTFNSISTMTVTGVSEVSFSSSSIFMNGTNSPPTAYALCLASTGQLGHCTSVVGAGGTCTCSAP